MFLHSQVIGFITTLMFSVLLPDRSLSVFAVCTLSSFVILVLVTFSVLYFASLEDRLLAKFCSYFLPRRTWPYLLAFYLQLSPGELQCGGIFLTCAVATSSAAAATTDILPLLILFLLLLPPRLQAGTTACRAVLTQSTLYMGLSV